MNLHFARLTRTLQALGCHKIVTLEAEVAAAYAESSRHYHNASHIADCLNHLDRHVTLASSPLEIELAIWFHDIVYDSRRSDNEERSAEWARRVLHDVGLPGDAVARVERMILATKHHGSQDADTALLLDIDLSILGAATDRFEAYDRAIRMEYAWVPLEDFKRGRCHVLSSFLARPQIFATEAFRLMYELQARANLQRKIADLNGRTE